MNENEARDPLALARRPLGRSGPFNWSSWPASVVVVVCLVLAGIVSGGCWRADQGGSNQPNVNQPSETRSGQAQPNTAGAAGGAVGTSVSPSGATTQPAGSAIAPTGGDPAPGEARPSTSGVAELGAVAATPSESSASGPSDSAAASSGLPSANPRQRRGKHSGVPFDPIKENGPIFVEWPAPKLALVITGHQHGYIEPCGCAGLDRMKGGMSRRHTMFEDLRRRGWPVVGLDAGSIARGFGRQAELKFHTMVEGMRKMGYDAINLGRSELELPAGELVAVAGVIEGQDNPFLSANVVLFDEPSLVAATRIIQRAGRKIGITGVVGLQDGQQVENPELKLADPEAAAGKALESLRGKTDYRVLLVDAPKDEAIALAKRLGDFQLVVTTGGAAEPPSQPTVIDGTGALLVEVGEKGMNAVVLALFDDPKTPWRYQRVPLDSRWPASQDMHLLLTAYQDQLKAMGFEGLAVRPSPHPQRETNGRFVGSAKCESCHDPSYRVWKKSGHAKAWATLAELDPPRTFDPECISCHVVGWHPTKYYPYESGFLSEEKTPNLVDVGCESCHGPGENHVKAEMGSDLAYQEAMRKAVVITKEESQRQQCYTCHDLDNSPDFDFESYWPLVEHYENE